MKAGDKFDEPFFEVTTKLERVDRLLVTAEAEHIAALEPGELDLLRSYCRRIDESINTSCFERGLIHVDGKKEFGRNEQGKPMVVDVFGTPDEDRFWDREAFEKSGEMIDLSKEFVRQHYRDIGFKDAVYEARAKKQTEPAIPPMPPDLIARASDLYVSLFERLTGEKF